MKKYRIGNDVQGSWTVLRGTAAESFSGKTLKLYAISSLGQRIALPFVIEGNVITFTFPASKQKTPGAYCMLLEEYNAEGVKIGTLEEEQALELGFHSETDDDDLDLSATLTLPANGMSAYQIAVANGYEGTVTEWLASLKGADANIAGANAAIAAAEAATQNANSAVVSLSTVATSATNAANSANSAAQNANAKASEASAASAQAASDHAQAVSDHTIASSDHVTALSDHSKVSGAEYVDADISGRVITVTNRQGTSKSITVPEGGGVSDAYTKSESDALLAGKASASQLDDLVLNIGQLSNLQTTEKSNLVSAINEIVANSADNIVNILDYQRKGDLMPISLHYCIGSIGFLMTHNRLWIVGSEVHLTFCYMHDGGSGNTYIDYKIVEAGDSIAWECVNAYDINSVPQNILRQFCENKASTTLDGLMSKEDKTLLGTLNTKCVNLDSKCASKLEVDEVKTNGNIVLKDGNGNKKEYMSATPSGSPMHDMFTQLKATYNKTNGYWEYGHLSDLTNDDMLHICKYLGIINQFEWQGGNFTRQDTNIRAFPTLSNGSYISMSYSFSGCTKLEELIISGRLNVSNLPNTFCNCSNLKYISGGMLVVGTAKSSANISNAFKNCNSLIELKLYSLSTSISFADSPNLNTESIAYMINNSTNLQGTVITLHPTAYANAIADSEVLTALRNYTNVTLTDGTNTINNPE